MHIPDNYLSPATCAALFALSAYPLGRSAAKVKVQLEENKEMAPMLGVASSLSFLMMMFNVPLPGGTTAHAVGGTLLAILIGPYAACIAMTVALFLQAFLFGDGGILALGANIFNMAVIMPFLGYGIYQLFRKHGHDQLGVILASYLGINGAALLVGLELGLQPLLAHSSSGQPLYNPYGLTITIPAMLLSHLAIVGWIEAFFTYVIYRFVRNTAPDQLYQGPASRNKSSWGSLRRKWLLLLLALLILTPLGLLSGGTAFGEWSNEELQTQLQQTHQMTTLPKGMQEGINFQAFLTDYTIPGTPLSLGYILSALIVLILLCIFVRILKVVYGHGKR